MSKIKVVKQRNYLTVIAIKKIFKGEVILKLEGSISSVHDKYSLQVTKTKHLHPFSDDPLDESSYFRFLNHSCSPNSYFNFPVMTLVALRDIDGFEPVTFHYCTTEYDMSSPFKCLCKSNACYVEIKGFRYLQKERQEELLDTLADHLKKYCE